MKKNSSYSHSQPQSLLKRSWTPSHSAVGLSGRLLSVDKLDARLMGKVHPKAFHRGKLIMCYLHSYIVIFEPLRITAVQI